MADITNTELDDLPAAMRPGTGPWTPTHTELDDLPPEMRPNLPSEPTARALATKQYLQGQALERAQQKVQNAPETTRSYLARRVLPGGSALLEHRQAQEYHEASRRLEQGIPRPEDYDTIAGHERIRQLDAEENQRWGGFLGNLALRTPAFLGEAVAGGHAARGLGLAAQAGQSARVAIPMLAAKKGGELAVRSIAMPSVYARAWAEGNQKAGRDPLDFRGFPAAYGLALAQNAVFDLLGPLGAGSFQGEGARQFLGRRALEAGKGIGAIQGADIMTTALSKVLPASEGLDTGFGTIGLILDGKHGEALKHAVANALTFATLGAAHEIAGGTPAQRLQAAREARRGVNLGEPAGEFGPPHPGNLLGYKKPPVPLLEGPPGMEPGPVNFTMPVEGEVVQDHPALEALAGMLVWLKRQGLKPDAAAARVRTVPERILKALHDNPQLDPAQARQLFANEPDPVRNFAHQLIEAIARPQAQAQIGLREPPPGPPGGIGAPPRQVHPPAEGPGGIPGGLPGQPPGVAPEPPGKRPPPLGPPGQPFETILPPPKPGVPAAFPETRPEPAAAPESTSPTPPPAEASKAPGEDAVKARLLQGQRPPAKPTLAQQRQALYERLLKEGRSKPSAAAAAEARFPLAEGESPLYPHGPKQEVPTFTPPEPAAAETADLEGRLATGLGQGVKNPERVGRLKEKMRQKAAQPPRQEPPAPEPAAEPAADPVGGVDPRAEQWSALLKSGLGLRSVGKKVGVSYETVRTAVRDWRAANGEQGTDAAASAAERGQKKASQGEGLQNVEGMQKVGRDRTKAYWDEEARKVGLDRDELHGRVADEIAPEQQALRHLTDLLRELRASLKEFDPQKKARNFRHEKYQDPDSIAHLDEVVTQYRDRLQPFARPGEELTDTAYRLLHEGVDLETRRADKYQQVFNELLDREEQREREKARRAGIAEGAIEETVRAGESAGEAEEVAGPGEAEEPAGGDTSFDFGANEPGGAEPELKPLGKKDFPLGPGERPGEAPLPESTWQGDLFGGAKKSVAAQREMFGGEETGKPEQATPVDERQQGLFESAQARMEQEYNRQLAEWSDENGQFKGLVLDFLKEEGGFLDLKRLGELGKNLWDGLKNSPAADWLRSFAQQQFPTITRLARPSGEALAEAANSRAAAKAAWDYFANKLTVDAEGKRLAQLTPEERRLIGAVWWEMRARHYAAELRRRGQSAEEIGSLIGQEGSPLPDEATFTREQERLKPFFEQVKAEWTPAVEANFKDIKGLDPEDEIHSPSQIPGLPLNAIPLTEAEATLGAVRTGKSQSMQNLKLSNPAFTKKAALSAPAYDLDVANMMQRTLNLGVPAAARARFARQALADGILVKASRGQSLPDSKEYTYLGLDPNHGLPGLEPNARYYVKNQAFREVVQGLGIGERPGQTLAGGLRPVMDKIYNLAMTSPVELMTHVGNHVTALFRPGMGIPLANLKESFTNAWKVMQKDPEILKKVWDLARIGAGFEHEGARPGLLGEKLQKYDPTAWFNHFTSGIIDVMQKAVRLQLGDAFDRMADAGHFPRTETARRNFINQALGNYNSQAGNRLAQFLKDTGLQSFATAAHTFTTQGLKAGLGGAINAPATSGQAALQVRAQALLKLLPVLALAPVANYLLHKDSFPEDVPAFAIKTREGEQGKVHYFDPLRFTGIRRGWRGLGINALIEGGRNGEPAGKIMDRASQDLLMTGEHLFAGPPVQALHTLMTGENALGHKVAGKQQPGESKYYQNAKATALGVNPVVASLTQADRPRNPRTLAENLAQSAGPFGETTRDQRRPAPVQNYYSFLGELNDLRRDSPERRAGKLFPQERQYRVLEAYKSAIDKLDHAIRGEVVRPTGVIQGPKPSAERAQQLRKQQADLARRALAAIGR